MPVRNVMKNPGIDSYAVPTDKLDRLVPMVHCEGPNERDYVYLLEYDPMVVSYEEQPCKIAYIFEQKKRWYTPDFAVYWRHQQPSLVECKPASRLNDPENLQKWTAARLWCKQHHYTFMLVTDVALRQCGCLLANIKLLAGHGHQPITPHAKDYLLKTVQAENRALRDRRPATRGPQHESSARGSTFGFSLDRSRDHRGCHWVPPIERRERRRPARGCALHHLADRIPRARVSPARQPGAAPYAEPARRPRRPR